MTLRMSARLRSAFELLPVWYLWLQAFTLLDTEVRMTDPPLYDLAFTAVFPLAWFAAYYLVKPSRGPARTLPRALLLVTLSCALPLLLILVVLNPAPQPPDVLMRQMEVGRYVFAVLLAFQCAFVVSGTAFVKFFVVALFYGAILENGGIMGGFFSEPGYMFYIPGLPAPFVNVVGWSITVYMSVYIWQHIMERFRLARFKTAIFAVGVTAIALFQDLQIDPYATHARWWIWNDRLPPCFLGVPLLNFVAWLAAILPFGWLYSYVESKPGRTERERVIGLFLAIPVMLGAALAIVLLLTLVLRGPTSPDMEVFATALGLRPAGL